MQKQWCTFSASDFVALGSSNDKAGTLARQILDFGIILSHVDH